MLERGWGESIWVKMKTVAYSQSIRGVCISRETKNYLGGELLTGQLIKAAAAVLLASVKL